MIALNRNTRLLIIFFVLLTGFIFSNFVCVEFKEVKGVHEMKEAVNLAQNWFEIVKAEKEKRGIHSDAYSGVKNNFLIGDEFTNITTTLGSLNAKEISTNPDFAALITRLLIESGIDKQKTVAVIASASFPALTISTLAALQTLDVNTILMTSLGASTYGANQAEATWIDLENWLIQFGGLKYKSLMVSRGAENDNGFGLWDEGILMMQEAAKRNNIDLFIPESLKYSIDKRLAIMDEADISLLINIGGNQAALGRCVHSASIPNGLNEKIKVCNHNERGLIMEVNEREMPFINLLNIKDLAVEYGMDISPGKHYAGSLELYQEKYTEPIIIVISLLLGLLAFILIKEK